MLIFILNKSLEVVDTLSSKGDISKVAPFFDDEFKTYLNTGASTFKFTTLANLKESQHLTVGNSVAFMYKKEYKLFYISEVEEEHNDTFTKTVYCEMAGIELINEIVRPVTIYNANVRKFLNTVLQDTDWEVGKIDLGISEVYDFEISGYENVYSLLQEHIVGTYGGEIDLSCTIKNGKVKKRYVNVYSKRGNSNGFRFAYSSNISSINRTVDSSNIATALIGIGNNGITFKEVDVPDKPLNQDFIADEEAYKLWSKNGSHIFGTYNAETDSPQELLRLTRIELEKRKEPKVVYELQTELLGQDEISIGDTVMVQDTEFNPPIYLSARVSELTVSFTDNTKNSCVLSNFTEINSNITDEMRKLASQLQGYVDSQFPIGSNQIQDGAVGEQQISKQYHTQVIADAVYASLVQTEELIAAKADIGDLTAVNGKIENLQANKADVEQLNAIKAEIDDAIINKADIESLKAITAKIDTLYTDKANVTDLNATNATIENLKANKADISDLNATNATIENLQANKADVNELNALSGKINVLESNKANITDLNAANATIGQLQANKADIVELNTVKGNITTLESEIADINTLVNGNLTSENIHSLTLTAKNTTIENAMIKDAMIDSVNANKINAGKINTKKVTIESETGGIIIENNTQQFKDKNGKVRVQIGEDKSGQFTFMLLDESGTGTLIDHTGVKEAALGDDIIKDNMISSDAVGEKQINYSSMITGFNKDTNTNTIKATKIKLDNQNQTLEVGFNSLKTQADDTKTKTESNTTKLNVQQGQIDTLISNSTIQVDGKDTTIKDAYSKLQQTVNSFESTMGEHTTKISEVEQKADNAVSTANSASSKITAVESAQSSLKQDLSGFKTTVSNTYSTKTELSNLNSTVSSNSSKVATLEANLSSITQRVSSTETTTSTLTTKVNTAQSTADSAKSTATTANNTANTANTNATNALSTANSANTKINNLEIGGTNLVKNSAKLSTLMSDGWTVAKVDDNYNMLSITTTDTNWKECSIPLYSGYNDLSGKVTVSFEYKESATGLLQFNIGAYNGSTRVSELSNIIISSNFTITDLANEWKLVSYTYDIDAINNKTGASSYRVQFKKSNYKTGNIQVKKIKLEKGTKATSYSVAPEDVQSQIDTHTTQISTTNSKVSSIETNLSGITSRVSAVETKATTLDGKVTNQESRLATAESKITSSAIISTVSSTIDTKVNAGINGLEIGGTNLISDTTDDYKTYSTGQYYASVSSQTSCEELGLKDGDNVVFRVYLKPESPKGASARISYYYGDGTNYKTVTGNVIAVGKEGYSEVKTTLNSAPTKIWCAINSSDTSTTVSATGSYKEPKLEKGTKSTSWSKSIGDVEKQISDTETVLNKNIDSAVSDATNNILDNVSKNYASVDKVTQLQEVVSSNMTQTTKDINMQFTTAQNYTKEVDGKLQEYQNTVATNIRFSENGIELGKTSSPFTAVLDNTKLAFKQNGDEVAYVSNNKLHITQAEIKENLRIGKSETGFFAWQLGSSGNLSLKWSDN